MRIYCLKEKEWDEGVHLLLFTVCESVQESLGFSPFELLFGRVVRGPLKLLKETWLTEDKQSNILDHVSDLHSRISTAAYLAKANLKNAQGRMKLWYNKRARSRMFEPGNKVLVLLPIHHHPLQARYCGPYVIEKRLNEVDYVVYMPDRRKQRRVCHINMLKEYCESTSSPSIVPVANVVGLKDDLMMNEGPAGADVKLTNSDVLANLHQKLGHLSVGERESMVNLINKF